MTLPAYYKLPDNLEYSSIIVYDNGVEFDSRSEIKYNIQIIDGHVLQLGWSKPHLLIFENERNLDIDLNPIIIDFSISRFTLFKLPDNSENLKLLVTSGINGTIGNDFLILNKSGNSLHFRKDSIEYSEYDPNEIYNYRYVSKLSLL